MPTTTITHESWCQEHVDEAGWNMCNSDAIQFGPCHDAVAGDLWLSQDEHEDTEAKVTGSYGRESFRVDVGAARAFLAAASEDPAGLVKALSAALAHLQTAGITRA